MSFTFINHLIWYTEVAVASDRRLATCAVNSALTRTCAHLNHFPPRNSADFRYCRSTTNRRRHESQKSLLCNHAYYLNNNINTILYFTLLLF